MFIHRRQRKQKEDLDLVLLCLVALDIRSLGGANKRGWRKGYPRKPVSRSSCLHQSANQPASHVIESIHGLSWDRLFSQMFTSDIERRLQK